MLQTINGIRMNYSLQGPAGKPVVALLHGFPFSSDMWKDQVLALKGGFRVLCYDLRGMGKSGLGPHPQLMETFVDDLFALLDHLKIKSAALTGLSMGGYVALRAAERDPARFWALALCDTRADADGDQAKIGRAGAIKSIRAGGTKAFAKAMLPKLLAPQTLSLRPEVGRELLKMMGQAKADGMANALAAMAGRSDTHGSLKQYHGPVLAVAGKLDLLAPPSVAQDMAQEARQGRFVEIPGAGHVSNLENPEAFNQALMDFLLLSLPS